MSSFKLKKLFIVNSLRITLKLNKMETSKKLVIWMDHSDALLMDFTTNSISIETKIVTSKFTNQEKEQSRDIDENLMHNKEQHKQSEYYKKLANVIKNYNEVILFGSTDAKTELFNILKADLCFMEIKIKVKETERMTEYQQNTFAREHFKSL